MIRQINDAGLKLIEEFEALRLKVYHDVGGRATIGFGHLIKPGEDYNEGITQEKAQELLEADLKSAEQAVERLITAPLNDNQFAALVSLVFNCGTAPLEKTLGHKLNQEDYDGAAESFLIWDHVNGAVSEGLERRRKAEKELFQSI